MEVTHGYQYDKSDGHNSPNGTWYRAESGGKQYFLKKFQKPKFPKDGIDPKLYKNRKQECDEWLSAKKKLIKALNELGNGNGNIISPEMFSERSCAFIRLLTGLMCKRIRWIRSKSILMTIRLCF